MGLVRELLKRIPLARRSVRWGRVLAARMLSKRVDRHTLLARIDGLTLFLDRRDTELTPHLILRRSWEPAVTRAFLNSIHEGSVVADVGANVGWFTLQAARAVGPKGKVFAFEPEPRNFELLSRSVEANGFTDRVVLSPKAVSDRVGEAPFHVFPESFGGSHSLFAGGTEKHITVETTTLDEALPPGVSVGLVKIDVEGAEPFVLRGMRRMIASSRSFVILSEWTPELMGGCGPAAPSEMLNDLRAAGFAVSRFTPSGRIEPADDATLLGSPLETLLLTRPG